MQEQSAIPAPMEIALGYAKRPHRPIWQALFQLDCHLAMLTSQAREPLLAQLRLAWWRDALSAPSGERPDADPLLESALRSLGGMGPALSDLASAWECLIGEAPLPASSIRQYLDRRSAAYGAAAEVIQGAANAGSATTMAAQWWVAGDTSARLTNEREREAIIEIAGTLSPVPHLTPALRPLAILAALGRRAVVRQQPVLEGRGAALLALRLGMFGR